MASHARIRRSRRVYCGLPCRLGSQRDARARPGRRRAPDPEVGEIEEVMTPTPDRYHCPAADCDYSVYFYNCTGSSMPCI